MRRNPGFRADRRFPNVIPAEAGISGVSCRSLTSLAPEIPASAGMTTRGRRRPSSRRRAGRDHRLPGLAVRRDRGERLVPIVLLGGEGAGREEALVAEFEDLEPVGADRVIIGRVGGDEEALADAELLGAEPQRSADDIIEAVLAVAVARQGKMRLEPVVDEREAGEVDQHLRDGALAEAGFEQPGPALHRAGGLGLEMPVRAGHLPAIAGAK